MEKLAFRFQQEDHPRGYKVTLVIHIGARDDKGKFIKFIKQTPEFIEFLQNQEWDLDIPDRFIEFKPSQL